MPTISVIVPVYKVERYLARCVDSILAQTHSDFELVLVDDGSPDKCGAMCDEYALKDKRIHVIHQENGGLSAARNAGIDWVFAHSDSDWLIFVDSDDWIHPQCLELLLRYSLDNRLSICMGGILVTGEMVEYQAIPQGVFSIETTNRAFQDESLDPSSACCRLFRRELFRTIRFPVGKLHEDRFTTYKIYFQLKEVGVIHTPLYYYFENQSGITRTKWHPGKMDNLEAAEQQLQFFRETNNEEMYCFILKDYIHLCVFFLRCISNKSEYAKYACIIRGKLRRTLFRERKRLNYNLKDHFGIYKYAYPFAMRVYRRLFMRGN